MNAIFRNISLTLVGLLLNLWVKAQTELPVFLQAPTPWADSLIQTLTLDQKIGQLFMVAAWSDPKHQSYDAKGMELLIEKYGIGGVIFFQGSPVRQAQLTNRFQAKSKVPLLIGMDAEWGLGMRLDSTIAYPRQMTLGAVQDDSLIYEFGTEMARQLKRLGVHISFSPVVDINNNPKNPVISNRSFGEDRELVTRYSEMYMRGLQEHGVLANAKHFPGHGDTDSDSHKDLPIIPYSRERLDSLELYPYYDLFNKGLSSVMIAHLYVPALDSTPNRPSTVSPIIVDGFLKQQMGFKGLVFTDAMNMQGVAKHFNSGEGELAAFMAGNDVILYPMNIPMAIEKIREAVDSGMVTEAQITDRCLKILRAKEWSGLDHFQPIATKGLISDLNNGQAQLVQRRLIENSITVLKNNCSLTPICHSDSARVAVVSIGVGENNTFTNTLRRYAAFDAFTMDKFPEFEQSMKLHDTLCTYDLVIAAFLNTSNRAAKNFGVSNEAARIMNSVGEKTNVMLGIFANPYSFEGLRDLQNVEGLFIAYQDDSLTQQVTAEVIGGACTADGRLPVRASKYFNFGDGLTISNSDRLRWVSPSYLGICAEAQVDSGAKNENTGAVVNGDYKEDMMASAGGGIKFRQDACFEPIDSIAKKAIRDGAFPGCRILIAKDAYVIYDRAFGYTDYEKTQAVDLNTVYDLASITKVAASTIAAMKLVDEGKLDIEKTIGDYIQIPSENPYAAVPLKDMLAHTAGFTPWIPFYTATLQNGQLDSTLYKSSSQPGYSVEVAKGLFIKDNYEEVMFNTILNTPLSEDRSYKYSDLTFYFMQRIIESITGQSLDVYVRESFYAPMGLESMGYNPLIRVDEKRIAPTEFDKTWRKQVVKGYVHDQGAAMMGGVGGHAGLFGTAQDLAAIMQMLVNGGQYAGQQFISKETIDLFNQRYFEGNRRGLGFDKPALSLNSGSACNDVSDASFGHTGFTGTMCWADPDTGIVYVFLSNRVYPDAENKKIQDMNIRTKIQHQAYQILGY